MKKITLSVLLCPPLMLAACSGDPADKVDEGKGAPTSSKEIVVDTGINNEPKIVIDDKGNPVLNDDGTPKLKGTAPGPKYNGEMPRRFQGVWALRTKDCEAGSGPTRMRIGKHNVIYDKSEAMVKKVDHTAAETIVDMEVITGDKKVDEQHRLSMNSDGVTMRYNRNDIVHFYMPCSL